MVSHFAMLHMVQDRLPELSASEAHIIITTVETLHRNERMHAVVQRDAAPSSK